MTGEMARELISLPKYTAYAKILKEDNSTQTVEKHKFTFLCRRRNGMMDLPRFRGVLSVWELGDLI